MTRWLAACRVETLILVRQRFLHAGVISGLLWFALLLPMPPHLRVVAEPYILVGDIAIIGFFFIGGSVFFEKQERVLGAVICSPLRFREYLGVKVLVLLTISLVVALVVTLGSSAGDFNLILVIVGVFGGTILMLLVGFASSLPFASVSDWFLAATVPLAVMSLPVLHYSGLWPTPVLYLIPTQGPLLLFGAAYGQLDLAAWQLGYAVGYPIVATVGLYYTAKAMFRHYVVERAGVATT